MMNIFRKKEWSENYYDTWGGVGPKAIPGGFLVNGKIACFWWTFDWRPAREPYDIGR
jgi:hypothetical protein